MPYRAPLNDIHYSLNHIVGVAPLIEDGIFGECDHDLLAAIIAEAGKFAEETLAPLNKTGDQEGAQLSGGEVTTAKGWKAAYQQWAEGGWGALSAPASHGGQNLPHILAQTIGEIWNSANLSFGLCPLLTQGAIDAIKSHGSDALQNKYLPKMITGEWAGTMNLTEPQAGSDLGAIKAKAVRQSDGSYKITGTKIFITYGEHDLTKNIIHLVLARLPDAPQGTRGISMFLVPKYLVNEDGSLGARNDVICTGLEQKLGIHASPTCVMTYGEGEGAIGYLVGEENRGLYAMFTMMNLARLSVGTQGVAIAERSFQQALDYAKERKQGQTMQAPHESAAIIKHPDVAKNLLTQKALITASRAICMMTARAIDLSERSQNPELKRLAGFRAALLTPIAKAFATDCGVEASSLGIQVHGGMGFIEESGAAQYYRDARILPIYEGTNGIQAIDLVKRKLALDDGTTIKRLIGSMTEIVTSLDNSDDENINLIAPNVTSAIDVFAETTLFLTRLVSQDVKDNNILAHDEVLASATAYLRLAGLTLGGAYMLKGTIWGSDQKDPMARDFTRLTFYYAENILPETKALGEIICNGTHSTLLAAQIFD